MKAFTSVRVLIVDDNRQMRILVRELLRALEVRQCAEAEDAEQAARLLHAFRADLVITDLALGREDGITLVKRIRTLPDPTAARVPIIMMTGHSERSRVAAALEAGVNTFLAKPISARALADHVAAALGDRRPFVRSTGFTGPERRRGADQGYEGPWRRADDAADEEDDTLTVRI
jgi:CheY-like chemotaxis protein